MNEHDLIEAVKTLTELSEHFKKKALDSDSELDYNVYMDLGMNACVIRNQLKKDLEKG
jgi:hypothetical protein